MTNIEAGAAEGSARIIMYQFLAMALYEPAENLFAIVEQNDNISSLLEASCSLLGSRGEQLTQAVLAAIRGTGESLEASLLDLEVEYNRLFVGPMPPVCPPYESVFDRNRPSEDQGTMMGPTAEAMDSALRAEGLELTLDYAELPDHMAIEVEFMYYLLSRAVAGENDSGIYLQRANTFLIEHLSQWLPGFGVKVSKESRHPFYQNIGLLLEATINSDLELVMGQK